VPLPELLAQKVGTAPASKKVTAAYASLLANAGPELPLLLDAGPQALAALGEIGQMILRVREGRVIRQGGFDGEYGVIRVEP
jgi:PHP family Zn ribbon phosphoesterase